ncbi:MAG: hypothetical protein WA634_01375 [Silvibacterium sp.]
MKLREGWGTRDSAGFGSQAPRPAGVAMRTGVPGTRVFRVLGWEAIAWTASP